MNKYQVCEFNQKEGLAINLDKNCPIEKRVCCYQCLLAIINDKKLISFSDFFIFTEDLRNQNELRYYFNLQLLQSLAKDLKLLQKHCNGILEQMTNGLEEQIKKNNTFFESQKGISKNFNYNQYQNIDLEFKKQRFQENEFLHLLNNQVKQFESINLDQWNQLLMQYQLQNEFDFEKKNNKTINNPSHIQIEQGTFSNFNFICQTHEKKIILFDLSQIKSTDKRLVCVSCISGIQGTYTELETVKLLWEEYELKNKKLIKDEQINRSWLKESFRQCFEAYKIKFQQFFLEIQNVLDEKIEEQDKQNQQVVSEEKALQIAEILSSPQKQQWLEKQLVIDRENKNILLHKIIKDLLKNIKAISKQFCFQIKKFTTLPQRTSSPSIINSLTTNINIVSQNYKIQDQGKFYLLEQTTFKQSEKCYAIAFNRESNILIAGCDHNIKVFTFNEGIMKEKQSLQGHNDNISSLVFMQKNNQFISGGYDSSILIWSIQNDEKYYCKQQILQIHENQISCLIINLNEDTFFSAGFDGKIKIWGKAQNNWNCIQVQKNHTCHVLCISLNKSQNKIASCDRAHQLFISEKTKSSWQVIQVIKFEEKGYRLSFIGDSVITFQPRTGSHLIIFWLNQRSNEFIQKRDIRIQDEFYCSYYFPLYFNKKTQMLISKHGKTLNLFRKVDESNFRVIQSINFDSWNIYGAMTNCGRYIVTYELEKNQFQVRKYEE